MGNWVTCALVVCLSKTLLLGVFPQLCKQMLFQKLPQLAALHYNNCMYLSHHCITLGHQFRNSLPGKLNSTMATFIDYVHIVRKCGTDCFLEQLVRKIFSVTEKETEFSSETFSSGEE